MIACYLELCEEGEVKHINGVRPSFLENTAVSHSVIFANATHVEQYACTKNTYKCCLVVTPLALESEHIRVKRKGNGWLGPLICSTSPSSYNPK